MTNGTNISAANSAGSGRSQTVFAGAACGFLGFLLCEKLGRAVVVALGWAGSGTLSRIGPEHLMGAGFGIAWAFKRPLPFKAMCWQSAIFTLSWFSLIAAAAVFGGHDSKPEDVWHGLIEVTAIGALSGFVTAWLLPHLLGRLPCSSGRSKPSSFTQSQGDVTYEI